MFIFKMLDFMQKMFYLDLSVVKILRRLGKCHTHRIDFIILITYVVL